MEQESRQRPACLVQVVYKRVGLRPGLHAVAPAGLKTEIGVSCCNSYSVTGTYPSNYSGFHAGHLRFAEGHRRANETYRRLSGTYRRFA